MGLWGAIKNFGAKVWAGAKNIGSKIVDGCKKAKEGVKNLYGKFSGKKTFEEAEELYAKISERYNSRRRRFDADVEMYSNQIEKKVDAINNYKQKIKKELFPSMADKLSRLYDFNLTEKFSMDEFNIGEYKFDDIRDKDKLYKIDFNKHPFKTNLQAILTLGFYTRKKAKETLHAVQEEEGKINTEIAKMDVETKRLETIDLSLNNIERYFAAMTETYENLLVRVDNSINFLFVRCMSFAHKIVKQEMSVRYLSRMQIKEIEAIMTASKILKQMAEMQILSVSDDKEVEKLEKAMKSSHEAVMREYDAA